MGQSLQPLEACSNRSIAHHMPGSPIHLKLDRRYAVFGQVTNGLEVVGAIREGDRITKAVVGQP